MAKNPTETEETHKIRRTEDETEDEDDEEELDGGWEDWSEGDDGAADGSDSDFRCLFCDSHYSSCGALFDHCNSVHHFDFNGLRKALGLDFYASFKLINYVRSQVAEHRCWSCGLSCKSDQDLHSHLHQTVNVKDIKLLWDDEKYLKPFMQDDSLLYSFGEDEEGEDDSTISIDKEQILRDLENFNEISIETEDVPEKTVVSSNGHLNIACSSKISLSNRTAKDIKDVNDNYFGAYSSFGIHREMISDKVRMDAYRQAILKNPSLLKGAVVMDVGCGTGVLSLFAAQAGASRVVAIEASEKMAKVATEIAKNNKLLRESRSEGDSSVNGVIEVVQSMVEEVEKSIKIQPQSVDVLVSEWMGYCLLYETMLNSVLFARDKWLKPGGAMLPDTATILVAGFGKGGTSLPFWEDVFGFDMSCIGKELVEDAAKNPIVDVVDSRDIVTNSAVLQAFDLVTMKPDEVDFTASVELEPSVESKISWCHGVVLWFETGFTSRFCKEMPAVLSTSPFTPRTHWSQTIFTFKEPIAIARSTNTKAERSAEVGTEMCPAARLQLRISIARAAEYRSIDISLETTGVGQDDQKRKWPVQIFNLE